MRDRTGIHRNGDAGFGIIEVLVALVLMAIVVGGAAQALSGYKTSRTKTSVRSNANSLAQRIHEDLKTDAAALNACNGRLWRPQEKNQQQYGWCLSTNIVGEIIRKDSNERRYNVQWAIRPVDEGMDGRNQNATLVGGGTVNTRHDVDHQTRDHYEFVVRVWPTPDSLAGTNQTAAWWQANPVEVAGRANSSNVSLTQTGALRISVCSHYRNNQAADARACRGDVACEPRENNDDSDDCNGSLALEGAYVTVRYTSPGLVRRTFTWRAGNGGLVRKYDLAPGDYEFLRASFSEYRTVRAVPDRVRVEPGRLSDMHVVMTPQPKRTRVCYRTTTEMLIEVDRDRDTYTEEPYGYTADKANLLWKEFGSPVYRTMYLDPVKTRWNCNQDGYWRWTRYGRRWDYVGGGPRYLDDPLSDNGGKLYQAKHIVEINSPSNLEVRQAYVVPGDQGSRLHDRPGLSDCKGLRGAYDLRYDPVPGNGVGEREPYDGTTGPDPKPDTQPILHRNLSEIMRFRYDQPDRDSTLCVIFEAEQNGESVWYHHAARNCNGPSSCPRTSACSYDGGCANGQVVCNVGPGCETREGHWHHNWVWHDHGSWHWHPNWVWDNHQTDHWHPPEDHWHDGSNHWHDGGRHCHWTTHRHAGGWIHCHGWWHNHGSWHWHDGYNHRHADGFNHKHDNWLWHDHGTNHWHENYVWDDHGYWHRYRRHDHAAIEPGSRSPARFRQNYGAGTPGISS